MKPEHFSIACLAGLALAFSPGASGQEMLVSTDFVVPEGLKTDHFELRKLTADLAEADYEAVQANLDHLQGMFIEPWGWPSSDLTLEQNVKDLERLEQAFEDRVSFSYSVLTSDGLKVIGCVYIVRTEAEPYDAEVTLWASAEEPAAQLDEKLFETVNAWIADDWPFSNVAYPGREISWDEYSILPGGE